MYEHKQKIRLSHYYFKDCCFLSIFYFMHYIALRRVQPIMYGLSFSYCNGMEEAKYGGSREKMLKKKASKKIVDPQCIKTCTTTKILINDTASTSVRNTLSCCFIGGIFVITMLLNNDGGTNTIFEGCFLLFPRCPSKAPSSSWSFFQLVILLTWNQLMTKKLNDVHTSAFPLSQYWKLPWTSASPAPVDQQQCWTKNNQEAQSSNLQSPRVAACKSPELQLEKPQRSLA